MFMLCLLSVSYCGLLKCGIYILDKTDAPYFVSPDKSVNKHKKIIFISRMSCFLHLLLLLCGYKK